MQMLTVSGFLRFRWHWFLETIFESYTLPPPIQDEEAESWQQNFPPEAIQGLTPVEVKRQEHIYEFILTESNHCQVLKVVQKIFVEGMYKYLNMPRDVVERIFPCMDEMIDLHFRFLERLRVRQSEKAIVDSLADILLEQVRTVG